MTLAIKKKTDSEVQLKVFKLQIEKHDYHEELGHI